MSAEDAGTATATLDQIGLGGSQLILITNQRLADVRSAIECGNFIEALEAAQAACAHLGPLASAQATIGVLAQNAVVRVADLEEGTVVPGLGEVKDIGPCIDCGKPGCHKVGLTIGDHSFSLDRDVEIIVER